MKKRTESFIGPPDGAYPNNKYRKIFSVNIEYRTPKWTEYWYYMKILMQR